MRPSRIDSMSLGVLGLLFALKVNAEPGVTSEGGASPALDEIVVTASKRVSTLQDTPISISAVSGSDLLARGVASLASLAQGTPGVSLKSEGPSQTEIEMRGMTSSGGNSATVGFYLDDIPLAGPAGAQNGHVVIDPDLYDLNRIEILRGPQGTLFGSGSMGGTVRLISNQPNLLQFQSTAQSVLSGTDGGGCRHRARRCRERPHPESISGLECLSNLCGAPDSAVEAGGKSVGDAVILPHQQHSRRHQCL